MVLTKVTEEMIAIFDSARSVAVLTGAGISTASGVPTFRGGGGTEILTWRGRSVTELSSAELLATDPAPVWDRFDYRRQSGAGVIDVNPERTDISALADVKILSKSGEILPQFTRGRG